MLFKNECLKSKYDFENEIPNGNISLNDLANEIHNKDMILLSMIENNIHIEAFHQDNLDQLIEVPIDSFGDYINEEGKDKCWKSNEYFENIKGRNNEQIINILNQKDRSSIKAFLKNIKIYPKKTNKVHYFKYLQILYFLYMTNTYFFPQKNILLLLSKHKSTFNNPVKRAGNGKYLTFFVLNMLDNENARKLYFQKDSKFTLYTDLIAKYINELISEKNNSNINEANIIFINKIIEEVSDLVSVQEDSDNPIDRFLSYTYQYQMNAYSEDFIKNLTKNKHPFKFKELNEEINPEWEKTYVEIDQIRDFIKAEEENLINYIVQNPEDKDENKEIDEIRERVNIKRTWLKNGTDFLFRFLDYDREIEQTLGRTLFFEEDSNLICKAYIAIILKTFYDISLDDDLKLYMEYRYINIDSTKWKKEKQLIKALNDKNNNLIDDLAMRLFIVAFHSEYLNTYAGYRYYYPLFEKIYLQAYILVSKAVNTCFSGVLSKDWVNRLKWLALTLHSRVVNADFDYTLRD